LRLVGPSGTITAHHLHPMHDRLRDVPPARLREHLLAALTLLRSRKPDARMFSYEDVASPKE
jgi:hypothetical protein